MFWSNQKKKKKLKSKINIIQRKEKEKEKGTGSWLFWQILLRVDSNIKDWAPWALFEPTSSWSNKVMSRMPVSFPRPSPSQLSMSDLTAQYELPKLSKRGEKMNSSNPPPTAAFWVSATHNSKSLIWETINFIWLFQTHIK